jgi:hypothetical protein
MARLVAVDLHRNTLFVVMADAAGHELWHRRFPATLVGETALLAQLEPGIGSFWRQPTALSGWPIAGQPLTA